MTTTVDLGKIQFTWKGNYNALTQYEPDDVVYDSGSAYIAIQNVLGVQPVTDTTNIYWNIINQGANSTTNTILNNINAGYTAQIDPSRKVTALAQGGSRHGDYWRAYLMANGGIKTSGASSNSQNGDNATRFQPNAILATSASNLTFTSVYQGLQEGYAIDSSGRAWAWGYNNMGQLGVGDTTNKMVMTQVILPLTGGVTVTKIYPTNGHYNNTNRSCFFLLSNGAVYGTGFNGQGQLGNNSTTNASTPVLAQGSGTTFLVSSMSVSGLNSSIMAITTTGRLYVWGYNIDGQLGTGNTTQLLVPTLSLLTGVTLGNSNVVQVITTADYHFNNANYNSFSMALLANGKIWMTGFNAVGQLGQNNTTSITTWSQVTQNILAFTFTQIQAADGYLGVAGGITGGNLYLWGYNGNGSLGNGTITQAIAPFKPLLGAAATFQGNVTSFKITSSQSYCTIYVYSASANMIYVAGFNGDGQLSNGTTTSTNGLASPYFQPMMGINGTIVDYMPYGVTTSQYGLSILYSDGRVVACGANGSGECGTRVNGNDQWTLANVLF